MRANPIRESGDLAGVENGKSATQSAFESAAEWADCSVEKKRGSRWAAPFMNGMKFVNMMFISIFPGNFSRALSLHCLNRSFFRICCMCFDLTFLLLLLRESALRFSAIPELDEQ
jgi:hypothetical protein